MKLKTLTEIAKGVLERKYLAGGDVSYIKFTLLPSIASDLIKRGIPLQINKHGVARPPKSLGDGFSGVAFDIGSNKVLKITLDPEEAGAANAIKGKTLKNVYRVFDVFVINDGTDDWYGILQEKLQKTSESDREVIGVLRKWLEEAAKLSFNDLMEKCRKELSYHYLDGDKKIESGLEIARQVKSGIDLLKQYGIIFDDAHGGNIMVRGGEYVLIDLGHSKKPPPADLPKINFKREV